MENFDSENIDELLEIRQIRQYFPPSKFVPYGNPLTQTTWFGTYLSLLLLLLK